MPSTQLLVPAEILDPFKGYRNQNEPALPKRKPALTGEAVADLVFTNRDACRKYALDCFLRRQEDRLQKRRAGNCPALLSSKQVPRRV